VFAFIFLCYDVLSRVINCFSLNTFSTAMAFPFVHYVFEQGSPDPGAYRGPPLLDTRLEEQAFSRLLDGIEVAVRPKWAHSVNRLLVENTIPRLNAKVGQFYSVGIIEF